MDEEIVLSNVKNQVYAVIIANLVIFCFGSNLGWFSPALLVLLSDETPLKTGPLTNEQLSNLGAANCIGAIFGTFIMLVLSMRYGSKHAMTFLACPTITFWLLVYFGDTFNHILMARFFNGLTGGGFQSGVVLYISEISNDNIRGRIGSVVPASRNLGMLMGYVFGSFIKYEYRPYIFIPIPIIFLILVHLLPSTAQYHITKDNYQKAEIAIKFYKGCNGKNEREKSLLNNEFKRMQMAEEERRMTSKFRLKDFCNRSAIKGFITSIAMSWFMQMTGTWIITNYASLIFKTSGSILDVNTSSICLAVVQILGSLVSTQVEFSRKTTLIVSLSGSALGLFTFAVYSYLRQNGYDVSCFLWLPVVCLSLVMFISSVGIVALANTCTLENFSPKIRPVGMAFYSLCLNAVGLLGDKFFPILLNVIHLHGYMLFLGFNCCLGVIFVAFMKETRGSNLVHTKQTQTPCDIKI